MKVIAKINKLPKIYLFFGQFEGEIFNKEKDFYIKSFKTNNILKIKKIKNNFTNKIKFVLGKFLVGAILILIGFYNFLNLNFGFNAFILSIIWISLVVIASYKKELNEDLILFIGYIITLIIIFLFKKSILLATYYYATDTLFLIGFIFITKGIKEFLYENEYLFITENKEFIIKAKEIK